VTSLIRVSQFASAVRVLPQRKLVFRYSLRVQLWPMYSEAIQTLLPTGTAATAIPAPFSSAGLAPPGGGVGAGLIAALPANACGLAETAPVTRYLADESAGQCGPCLFGLDAIAGQLQRLAEGRTSDLTMLQRWLGQVNGRGACSHPDGAVRLISSALTVFAAELDRHAQGWCCGTAKAAILPVPPRWQPSPPARRSASTPSPATAAPHTRRSFPSRTARTTGASPSSRPARCPSPARRSPRGDPDLPQARPPAGPHLTSHSVIAGAGFIAITIQMIRLWTGHRGPPVAHR
jgi:NADH-ubiquinone oxidoreductase-F iron-sulfur binding region